LTNASLGKCKLALIARSPVPWQTHPPGLALFAVSHRCETSGIEGAQTGARCACRPAGGHSAEGAVRPRPMRPKRATSTESRLTYSLTLACLLYSRADSLTVCSCRSSSSERHWLSSAWLLAGVVRFLRSTFRPAASAPPILLLNGKSTSPRLNLVVEVRSRKRIWENPPRGERRSLAAV
jgi:hypothetical protein